MNFSDKLHEVDQLLAGGHFPQAVTAAGQVLEELLRHLYRQALPQLSPADQKDVADKIERLGGGEKTADRLTLGQLVGVFREARLFEKGEKPLGLDLARLRRADLTTLVDVRNQAAHTGAVEEDEARLVVSQVHLFAREAGLLATPEPAKKAKLAAEALRPWSQVVRLNADVADGKTSVAAYAIDLGALVAGDTRIPAIYRQASSFFQYTHPTGGMQRLMEDVLCRLAGQPGDRVLQLRSPFGGGKSHVLAALYYAILDRSALLAQWPDAARLPDPGKVRLAVFDGEKFDVLGREVAPGLRLRTMWGWLAWQVGGQSLYQSVAYHDEHRTAPGGDLIASLVGPEPTLLLLDEVLQYFERASADTQIVGESTLARQTLNFIQSLSTEIVKTTNSVMIYTLQASARESFGNIMLLEMLDHLTARVDAKREPIQLDDILPVLRRRLLDEPPDKEIAAAVAAAYESVITQMRSAHAADATARQIARNEGLALRRRFAAAYPFHPTLIDIMRDRWASIPDFQRTRGALRFLATCLYTLKKRGSGLLLGPGDIPLDDPDTQNAFFTEVGQREAFKAVLSHDLVGPNARTRRLDDQLAREYPNLSGVCPATRLATAILMYSFGGLTRPGDRAEETIPTGVAEAELLAAVVGPDLDSITAQATLKDLREQCLYLHYDGARYVFKTTPNVTKLLEDEAENVREPEVRQALKEELESRLSGRVGALIWPADSRGISDREPRFQLAYLPFEFLEGGDAAREAHALKLLTEYGDTPRKYRNGLGLAIPNWQQVAPARRAKQYLKAIAVLRQKRALLNLTTEQMAELKEREDAEKSRLESAMRNLYTEVWLPRLENGQIQLEKLEIGGHPLQANLMHERLLELLKAIKHRLFGVLTPSKLIEHLRLGEATVNGQAAILGMSASQIRDLFFGTLGFTRLETEVALRTAIGRGVKEGLFGYVGRGDKIQADRLREGSGYYLSRNQAIIGRELPEDEIDLSAGFIVLPAAIEIEAEAPPPPLPPPTEPLPPQEIKPTPPPPSQRQTSVHLELTLNRQQVYASFNAFGNLAEKAGIIKVTVEAQSLAGFDPVWLRNAVLEPLEEADVEIQR